MKKESKGITLIALVITIIVLLILAGVSIATLAGDNGVLTKASDAKIINAMGSLKDEVNLKATEAVSEYYENIYVHKNDNGATVVKKYASMEPIREITKIADETTNTKVFSQTDLVRHIITKLAGEFTNNNTTGTEVSRNADLTIAIKKTDTGSSVTGTVTIKSKAVPSLKTVGRIQADGAIKWGDTFKRTASSGNDASETIKEIMNNILSTYDDYNEQDEAIAEAGIEFVGPGMLLYEGNYYSYTEEETSPDNWGVTKVTKVAEEDVQLFEEIRESGTYFGRTEEYLYFKYENEIYKIDESYHISKVEVAESKKALKIKVNSGSDGVVRLPIDTQSACKIDWGDGTVDDHTNMGDASFKNNMNIKLASADIKKLKLASSVPTSYSHTYISADTEYVVTITGDVTSLGSIGLSYDKDKILEIVQWGVTGLTMVDLRGCTNLRAVAAPDELSFINLDNSNLHLTETAWWDALPYGDVYLGTYYYATKEGEQF